MMKCKKIYDLMLWAVTGCSLIFFACTKDADASDPAHEQEQNRTVLAYVIGDINLWDALVNSINQLEEGWNDELAGNLIVYYDNSPHMPQFSSPVLLKIRHDDTDRIVSEVVKTYPDQDPMNPQVMRRVLSDVAEMYPAKSQGLIIATHGSGAGPGSLESDPHQVESRAIAGPERYNSRLEIYDLAASLPVHYEFILFHACLMGNVETAYALRDKCDYMIASAESLPGYGYPYDEVVPCLFAPQVDYEGFVRKSVDWYNNIPDQYYAPLTVSVVRTDRLGALAASLRPLMSRYAANPGRFYSNMSQAYQFCEIYEEESGFYDMRQVVTLQALAAVPDREEEAFLQALNTSVPYVGASKTWASHKIDIADVCGLSFYVPMPGTPGYEQFNSFYLNNYQWIKAAGTDLLMK